MSLSAVLTTPLTTVPAEYQVQCYITISNGGAAPITIKQIRPAIKSTPISFLEDKSSFSSDTSGAGMQIPAGGSLGFLMKVVFHGSTRGSSYDTANYTTYDMGCIIYAADGEVIAPTPIPMTVQQNTGGK